MFISKLTKRQVIEGQGDPFGFDPGPWLGEPVHKLYMPLLSEEHIINFIRKVHTYQVLILNKGHTNNELVAQFVLGTLTQKQLSYTIFVPVERVG